MSDSGAQPAGGRPVERFGPSSGQVSGFVGLAIAAFTVGYVAVAEPTPTGLKVALGALFFASLAWAVVLRPRVHVFDDRLVLRNAFRDTHVPLAAVEHVTLGQALTVWAEGERHQCLGVGRSGRAHLRAQRRQASAETIGAGEALAAAAAHDLARETYAVRRLRELAQGAQRDADAEAGAAEPVRHTWAWPEVAAVVVTGTAFTLSLLA
jgi:hypothetical protein